MPISSLLEQAAYVVRRKKETTVIFSTHILSDVERICDQIAFLHNGEIALQGTLEEVKGVRGGNGLEIEFCKPEDAEYFQSLYAGGSRESALKLLYEKKTEQDMMKMMGSFTLLRLTSLMSMLDVNITKDELLTLNRRLNRIRKK